MRKGETTYPNRRARLDAAIGLAMLPVGVTLGLVAALASVVLLFVAVIAAFMAIGVGGWTIWWFPLWWFPLWCFAAGAACAWIAVTAIEIASAFDWRPLPRIAAVVAVALAACPIWW